MSEPMTNEQITAEFAALFGGSEEPEEEEVLDDELDEDEEEAEDLDDDADDESEEDVDEDEEEDSEDEEDEEEEEESDRQRSKANYAFAEQRKKIKEQEAFIKAVGKLVGFDTNASQEDIIAKVQEALYEKESKETNVSVELLKRIEQAESLIQENQQIKLEKQVTESFTDLIEKHDLTKEEVDEFTQYLIDNDKNPMLDPNVDLESEYLKLHYDDMVQAAVEAALDKERKRKKKVDENSPSPAPKGNSDKDENKLTTVKDLDDLFASIDL